MADDVLDLLKGSEGEDGKPPAEVEKPAAPKQLTVEELDEKLHTRDTAILSSVQAMMQELGNALMSGRVAEKPKPEPEKPVEITREELYDNPTAALGRLIDAKLSPWTKKAEKPAGLDPMAVQAVVNTQLLSLKDKVGAENFTKYKPFLDQVVSRTDPRVIADPSGIDALWRLTVSYADEAMKNDADKRASRNKGGSLEPSSAGKPVETNKPKLDAAQSYVAEQMGIDASDFDKYSKAEEIEIGGALKKGAK